MGMMAKLRDLDARGDSILPVSTETRTEYLNRVAQSETGVIAPAVAALARELVDQGDRVAELEARLSRLDERP